MDSPLYGFDILWVFGPFAILWIPIIWIRHFMGEPNFLLLMKVGVDVQRIAKNHKLMKGI